MKKPYNGNARAKQVAYKLFSNGLHNSRRLREALLEAKHVETISHVTCFRWIEEFKEHAKH